jgi:PIN like domain
VKLLVDHNLPPRLALALHALFQPEDEVISLKSKFGRSNLKDEEWIGSLGREGGWAVLSADMAIAKKKPSRDLFMSAGLVGFFLSPAMQKWQLNRQCARVMLIWP